MTFQRSIRQRIREIAFLVLSIPLSVLLFGIVIAGLDSGTFLPLAVLLVLGLLTLMQWVAEFEVLRTNRMLGTDFAVVDNWFGHSFFSWAGVRERVTSLRSWMAVAYAFVAFGYGVSAAVALAVLFLGIALTMAAWHLLPLGGVTGGFHSQGVHGTFAFNTSGDVVHVEVPSSTGEMTGTGALVFDWQVSGWPTTVTAAICILIASLMLPRLARGLANVVEALLSGTELPRVERMLAKFKQHERVSERQVREAFEQEPIREQLADLSRREREILALMAQGKSNAGIAKSLYITEGSVEKHISSILSKLGLRAEQDSHRRVLAVLAYLGIASHGG